MWVMDNAARIGGGILIVAGLYQLSPLKDICLSKCRAPMALVLTSWRDGYGASHGPRARPLLPGMLLALLRDRLPARDDERGGSGRDSPHHLRREVTPLRTPSEATGRRLIRSHVRAARPASSSSGRNLCGDVAHP